MSQIDAAEQAAPSAPAAGRRVLFPTATGWQDQPAVGPPIPLTNAPTATTPEMQLGTEVALRDMSPALVKSAIDALADKAGEEEDHVIAQRVFS